jgi:hypothetical protein
MTKEAKIKKFKFAFLKPAAPNKELVKLKTKMEKEMKAASKKGLGSAQREAAENIQKMLKEIHEKDPKYYQQLLSYKMTKHWGEPREFTVWAEKAVQEDDVVKFLDDMMGDNPSDDMVAECFFHVPKIVPMIKKCWDKAPDRIVQLGVAYVEKNKSRHACDLAPFQSKVALELFKKGKRDESVAGLGSFIQSEDAREMAKLDPAGYTKLFLEGASPTAKMSLLKDPEVRAAISRDKATWKKLSESAPVLSFFDTVQAKIESKDPAPDDLAAEMAEAVFDELLTEGNALGMTYYTNTFTPPSLMMASSPEDIKKRIAENHKKGDKDSMPDQPAAQCDELVTVLKYVMEGALGSSSGVACKHIVIPGMVLTVPINTLPGGLLKNTFGGNVYDDSTPGTLTKQVLFTGNDFGDAPNAHTYLDVGGVLYDAVLGTKGKAVTDAVAEEFGVWDKTGYESVAYPGTDIYVAKSKSTGNYIVKESDDRGALKAAANRAGFSTAYRLTTAANLARYAKKRT